LKTGASAATSRGDRKVRTRASDKGRYCRDQYRLETAPNPKQPLSTSSHFLRTDAQTVAAAAEAADVAIRNHVTADGLNQHEHQQGARQPKSGNFRGNLVGTRLTSCLRRRERYAG